MLDLDDFKRANAVFGHDAADVLLTKFASRLRAVAGANDLVARLDGDEFAVVLQGVVEKADVISAVQLVEASLAEPYVSGGKIVNITACAGVSSFPTHGTTRAALIKNADIALYVAKNSGRGVSRIFEPAMHKNVQKRLSMLHLAREAISGDRIVANYQPKVDLRGGGLDGFEALLRWRHPSKGLQTPDTISGAFDDRLLAGELSDRMIQTVLGDMRRWVDSGVQFGHVGINAAAAEFKSGAFAHNLLEQLHRKNLPTALLQLEVTETVFLGRGTEHVEATLRTLANEGIAIALDDFGTGYASLSHLKKFPVSVLKIDRSFIQNLESRAHDATIVRAVINLGRSLGIKIVAEGIETENQAEFLRKHRCHAGQGYLFGKAVAGSLVPSLVRNWGKAPALPGRAHVSATCD
jgi:diguanylate cyclase (GGDEF)-like protein